MNSTSSSYVNCVFHGDRFRFAALVQDMRKTKLLTRHYANVMAMTVCTCRRKVPHRQPLKEQQVYEAADQAINVVNSALDKFALTSRELVTSSANIALKMPMTSQGRLIVVIHQALLGQTNLLEEERERNINCEKKAKPKIAAKYICKIIKKKKKKLPVKEIITLPMFGGSTSQLFHTRSVGPKFWHLCQKYGCVLEVDSEATGRYMAATERKTAVAMWAPSHRVARDVTKELTVLASMIQEQNNAAYRSMKVHRRPNSVHHTVDLGIMRPEDYKESLSEDFDKKAFVETKRDRKLPKANRTVPNNKTKAKRKDGSTFLGGHCFNCLMLYSDFRQGKDDIIQCRHHPGYLFYSQWTCCNETSDHVKGSSAVHHKNTGCVVKQQHTWRPHKKASRSTGAKTASFEKDE